jgi:hypothetical protein
MALDMPEQFKVGYANGIVVLFWQSDDSRHPSSFLEQFKLEEAPGRLDCFGTPYHPGRSVLLSCMDINL